MVQQVTTSIPAVNNFNLQTAENKPAVLSPKLELPADSVELSTIKKADNKSKTRLALWLAGAGALLAGAGIWLWTRGRNLRAAEEAARKASEVVPSELRAVKALEKHTPNFPKTGETVTVAKNGTKRIDRCEAGINVSRYYDKNGKLHREVLYDQNNNLLAYTRVDKNGKVVYDVKTLNDGNYQILNNKFDKQGRIIEIASNNGITTHFDYLPLLNGKAVSEKISKNGELLKTTYRTYGKDDKIMSESIRDVANNKKVYTTFNANGVEEVKIYDCTYEVNGVKLAENNKTLKESHTVIYENDKPAKVLIKPTGFDEYEVPYEKYANHYFRN